LSLKGYYGAVWESRPIYVAYTGVISTFVEPEAPATATQIRLAEKAGVVLDDDVKALLSMAEVNQLIYAANGGERYVAQRASIEREWESRRHDLFGMVSRPFTESALGGMLNEPHGPPSKRALHALNARGLLRIIDAPREIKPWSQGEIIRVVKRSKRRHVAHSSVEVVSDLRLLNALGGLDVDLDNGRSVDKLEVYEAIEDRLPTEIAERHMQLWGYAKGEGIE